MTSATARVPAKINLGLGVGPVREDGFHQLATVYQALDVHDEVRATLAEDSDDIEVSVHLESSSTESSEVPEGKDNLAVRAARALQDAMGVEAGARLAIRKVIPVAGGMAGGSADAAAALVACNAIWGTGLGRDELTELAADIGSDVPFLLHGGTAIGGGRGENISPILGRGSYYWVVAVSDRGLSTPAVYAEFDRLTTGQDVPQPSVPDDILAALRAGDPDALGDALSNDLAAAALSLRPDLRDVLAIGSGAGALGAIVSGSGPTCLFLAHDESHRLDLAMALASSGVCADVIQARGPVPGAHLIT
ncbi:MAG TPA: 4-(cytidine 5'-diphospho)-2-C-methyl-D-erythritol kinase [Aeromicrobium sp.]|nr:4-(cytidine 5'-diphospho)-2-C-methyl-D-erythritol kinase [Aeromicrobium sp.]